MDKKIKTSRKITTTYEKEEQAKKNISTPETEIDRYLSLITKLKKSKEIEKEIFPILDQIKKKLEALKSENLEENEIKAKIKEYTRFEVSEGQFMHLSAFLGTTGEKKAVKSEKEYLAQVQRMIRNTLGNLKSLVIFRPEDEKLKEFLKNLITLKKKEIPYADIKQIMNDFSKDGLIKYYHSIKLEFLKQWIAPFQKELEISVDSLTPEELQVALKKVEEIKQEKLEEGGISLIEKNVDIFNQFNDVNHEFINGESIAFWGRDESLNAFKELSSKIMTYFTFNLERPFLLFETKDKKVVYLLGISNESLKKLENPNDMNTLAPHLKVLFHNENGKYKEITKESVGNLAQYLSTLRVSVLPFLKSICKMMGEPLSKEIETSFEMWG